MEINLDDWELVNEDGYVFRRPKRQRPDSDVTATVPPPDPAAEARARRERKKKLLLKLKTRYEQEIHDWELLSNTLQALQERTQNQAPVTGVAVSDEIVSCSRKDSSDSNYQELLNTLLAQVEAQEASIIEISRLCDVAEALCDAEEQRVKQLFIDLPVWESSPRTLITSLLED